MKRQYSSHYPLLTKEGPKGRFPYVLTSHSPQETYKIAARLAQTLAGGDVLGLAGPLGAGKTTFVQGLARALGIKKKITSPTFILLQSYKVPHNPILTKEGFRGRSPIKTLTHIDCYRIDDPQQLLDIGIRDHLNDPHTLTVIEWADRVKTILPRYTHWVRLTHSNHYS